MRKAISKSKLLAIIMLLSGISASSYAKKFESGGLYYNIVSEEDRTVSVTYSTDSYLNQDYVSGDIEIPQKLIYNSKTYT